MRGASESAYVGQPIGPSRLYAVLMDKIVGSYDVHREEAHPKPLL
ncbi:hypothetical protein GCM10007972_15640 [Iodidimonas muriae]|uniref:Uncharacterized protein n=1 Tax=Iodidimonas muriae TaxID=261467 RepID=A0ABQ2LD57_9PROT|nr:hypothetical protein GCM10007972_15640 [Iodidimonas muriae]